MRPVIALSFVLLCAAVASADGPTTAPSTQPAAFAVSAPAREWFAQLASNDDAQREQARTDLMGLSRDDLPRLRALVEQNLPLAPAQAASLHEIVTEIYLAGETYTAEPDKGFLGFSWANSLEAAMPLRLIAPGQRLGVPVVRRFPGFPCYRMLHDGDLILGIQILSQEATQHFPNVVTQDSQTLINVISLAPPNSTAVLQVLRQGQQIQVNVELKPRPIFPEAFDQDAFFTLRQQKADEYWRQQFLPLLRPHIS